MTFPTPKTYVILVCATRVFWGQVKVSATLPTRQNKLAPEEYELDWSGSSELAVTC